MVAKVLLFCAQALFIQSISAQYLRGAYPALAASHLASPCGAGYGYADGLGYDVRGIAPASGLSASHGPGLAIASGSRNPPVGVSVASDNAIEGPLAVAGALPFLGTVALEGLLPTAGAGNVAYNCGTGAVGITAEDIGAAPLAFGAGHLGYGAGLGYTGAYGYGGCGCGAHF